jgi:predicted molibdopterin-dependent oxidoreductase YjgC
MAHKLTTCTFCGVGCGIYLETADNRVTGVYPSMSHPSNKGRICVRGWNVHEVASSPNRLKHPMIRKGTEFQEVSWPEAMQFITQRILEIRKVHGPDALAIYNSPRCSNEESYLLQKLARGVIGTNNVAHGTGVYSNNSTNVLLDMIGQAASTSSLEDLTKSEVIVVDGVDLGVQLPTIGGSVIRAKLAGAKLIVIDSRRHRVAEHADYFLQIKPGTEMLLYGAMAKVIEDHGLMDLKFIKAHCRQFEPFLQSVLAYDLLWVAEQCGVSAEMISQAALAYAKARTASLIYSTGAESRDAENIEAVVNLTLMTGHLGRKGSGLFALTEHNNLQGVCDMGMLSDRLPGYLPVADPAARQRFETLWKTKLPANPGLSASEVFGKPSEHNVRGVWICRYDPINTTPFRDVVSALNQMDLVVVQHLFKTATAQYAHVILPLVAFGEEQVSFTSTDRRIQLAQKVLNPPSGPIPCWQQITMVAQQLGADWNYQTAGQVMEEICEAVPSYSGAHYDNLERDYGRQWPCTKDKPLGTRFLFEDGIVGKPFCFQEMHKPESVPIAPPDYPMAMVFGHSLYYWHQNVLVQHSETLKRELRVLLLDYPDGFVEINDQDARKLEIRDGMPIRLVARTGEARTTARVTGEVRSGTIFVPFFVKKVMREILGQVPTEAFSRNKPVHVRMEKIAGAAPRPAH